MRSTCTPKLNVLGQESKVNLKGCCASYDVPIFLHVRISGSDSRGQTFSPTQVPYNTKDICVPPHIYSDQRTLFITLGTRDKAHAHTPDTLSTTLDLLGSHKSLPTTKIHPSWMKKGALVKSSESFASQSRVIEWKPRPKYSRFRTRTNLFK